MRTKTLRRSAPIVGLAIGIVGVGAAPAAADHAKEHHRLPTFITQVLVSDQASTGAAITDPHLVNPWGIAFGPTTPLWTANNGSSTSTLYRSAPTPTTVPLVVTTPVPTGIAFNPTASDFALPGGTHPNFLFDNLAGQISGWAAGTTQTAPVVTIPGAVFTGLSLAPTSDQGPLLFAADSASTVVDVFNGRWDLVDVLRDDHLPQGLAPYNVAAIGKRVYVSYAPPPGVATSVNGAIDVYDLNGRLRHRLVTGGVLDGPWGMVIAPDSWGSLAGALLVGDEDGGAIHAFDAHSGRLLGTLRDARGDPIGADGLWGMQFGNGVIGTPNDLVIAIGTDEYQHGLVELVTPVVRRH